jgi:hypothetical protein
MVKMSLQLYQVAEPGIFCFSFIFHSQFRLATAAPLCAVYFHCLPLVIVMVQGQYSETCRNLRCFSGHLANHMCDQKCYKNNPICIESLLLRKHLE